MSKKIQLTIADPCHESWDQMTAAEQGRFCASCQKQVVDFSSMSDSQLAAFFKRPGGDSVCGRFFQDQLDRDIEIPKKRIPWVKYFCQFALPAFLLSTKATAQGKVKVTTATSTSTISNCARIMGKISPLKRKTLVGDTVLMPVQKLKAKIINENDDSIFHVNVAVPNKSIVSLNEPLSCRSFVLGGISFSKRSDKSARITLNSDKLKKTAEKIDVISVTNTPAETLPMIKVYPNPVVSGTNINVGCQKLKEGYYTVQLSNQAGQQVLFQQTWIDAEAQVLNIDIPFVVAGVYFLKLTNKETSKRFTAKVIVE